MKRLYILLLVGFWGSTLSGRQLLDDLDMSSGRWEMVGVSLHNYKLLPIQDQMSAFIIKDQYILKQIQEKWAFEEVFEDYCEYHYALKIYKDGELMKTLKVNLLCDYISIGAFSYRFSMKDFMEYKRYFKPIRWSRIRFRDLDLLKTSVYQLDNMDGVYWYGDVKQYNFKGSFTIEVNNLPWNANKDSVMNELTNRLAAELKREDFYIGLKYWMLSDDFESMNMRLSVYCNEDFFKGFDRDYITRWRDHLSEQNFVQLVVIGLNKEEYFRVMRDYN